MISIFIEILVALGGLPNQAAMHNIRLLCMAYLLTYYMHGCTLFLQLGALPPNLFLYEVSDIEIGRTVVAIRLLCN